MTLVSLPEDIAAQLKPCMGCKEDRSFSAYCTFIQDSDEGWSQDNPVYHGIICHICGLTAAWSESVQTVEAIDIWNKLVNRPINKPYNGTRACPFCHSRDIKASYRQYSVPRPLDWAMYCGNCHFTSPRTHYPDNLNNLWNKVAKGVI
jgi:hypothetical protein